MANNKVVLASGEVIIDLTSDTVVANKLFSGYTAHNAAGNLISGTYIEPTAMTEAAILAAVNSGWNNN